MQLGKGQLLVAIRVYAADFSSKKLHCQQHSGIHAFEPPHCPAPLLCMSHTHPVGGAAHARCCPQPESCRRSGAGGRPPHAGRPAGVEELLTRAASVGGHHVEVWLMGRALRLQFSRLPPCIEPKAIGTHGSRPTHLGSHRVAKLRNAVGQVQTLQGSGAGKSKVGL